MSEEPTEHARLRHLVGAYVLGGIEPNERHLFEQHLDTCTQCLEELSSLQNLPKLLDSVSLEDALSLVTPGHPHVPVFANPGDETGTGPLMRKLSKRRRNSRRRSAALVSGAAALFLAIGFLTGSAAQVPVKPDLNFTIRAASGPQIQLGLIRKVWGTELALEGNGLPEQGVLSLWIKDKSGRYDRAASWNATAVGRAEVVGATPMAIQEMLDIEIRDGGGKTIAIMSPGTHKQAS